MLGHSSAAMTLDVYADLFDSDLMDVARLLDAAVQVETGMGECGQNVGKKQNHEPRRHAEISVDTIPDMRYNYCISRKA